MQLICSQSSTVPPLCNVLRGLPRRSLCNDTKPRGKSIDVMIEVIANKNVGDLESIIMNILLANGVDIDRLRFNSFGTEINIEAL